jgi:hypothetical protein
VTIPFSQVKPASFKLKVLPRYPAQYLPGPGIAIEQAAGVVTTSVDFSNLTRDDITDPTTLYVGAWDNVAKLFKLVLGANLKGAKGDPGVIGYPEPVVITGGYTVLTADQVIAIVRAAPSSTPLALPSVTVRNGRPLSITDWSTSVVSHTITITPSGTEKIMNAATLTLVSTADSLASVTLYPSTTLNGWYIAP